MPAQRIPRHRPAGPGRATGLERGLCVARTRLDARLDRLGIHGTLARDALGAAVVALVSVLVVYALLDPFAELLEMRPAGVGERSLILGLVAAQALALVIRRAAPMACLAVVAGFQVALIAVLPTDVSLNGAAPLIAAYTVGAVLPPRRALRAAGAVLLLQAAAVVLARTLVNPAVRAVLEAPVQPGEAMLGGSAVVGSVVTGSVVTAAGTVLLGVTAAAVGAWVRLRREQLADTEERLVADLERQRARADAAAAAERSRIARELHDIAAHHLSGLVVQASAAERLVDADPEAAKEMMRSVRAQGRRTLDNLRTAVGVLRDTGAITASGDDAGAPVPGLAVLEDLLEEARAAGATIELSRTGQPRELSPIADVSAYRIIQEALANARRHAPGAAIRVAVHHDARSVLIDVVNGAGTAPAAPSGGGFGLIGMRERVAMLGGSLEAGPGPDGGWRVRAHLPEARASAGQR